MLYRAILTAASVIALTATANAADMGSYKGGPASYAAVDWSGFYAGAHAGSASSTTSFKDLDASFTSQTGKLDGTDFIGGGQLGYNFQRGNIVFGVEADLGELNHSGSKSATPFVATIKNQAAGGFYGDVTGRVGYTVDKALVYAKGGFAFLSASDKFSINDGLGDFASASKTGLTGWTIGAGVEYLLTPAWSVKAEYQHFDFGDTTVALGAPYAIDSAKFTNQTVDAVTAGVNYHFGHGYDILK